MMTNEQLAELRTAIKQRRADLLIERRKIMARQHAIAEGINRFYPRSVGSTVSPAEASLAAEAEQNVEAIKAIDAALEELGDA